MPHATPPSAPKNLASLDPGARSNCESSDGPSDGLLIDVLWDECQAQLRVIASKLIKRESNLQTLQTTMLLNEAYVELRCSKGLEVKGQEHFSRLLTRMMKHALARYGKRRGLRAIADAAFAREAFEAARTAELRARVGTEFVTIVTEWRLRGGEWLRKAEIAEAHFLLGLKHHEIAESIGISERTVGRDLPEVRAWVNLRLRECLGPGPND